MDVKQTHGHQRVHCCRTSDSSPPPQPTSRILSPTRGCGFRRSNLRNRQSRCLRPIQAAVVLLMRQSVTGNNRQRLVLCSGTRMLPTSDTVVRLCTLTLTLIPTVTLTLTLTLTADRRTRSSCRGRRGRSRCARDSWRAAARRHRLLTDNTVSKENHDVKYHCLSYSCPGVER